MSIKKRLSQLKLNNSGYTLAELLAAMAVMAVLAGLLSYSIVMIYTRDAERSAKKINDVFTDARLYSMSKDGEFAVTLTPTASGTGNTIQIDWYENPSSTIVTKTYDLVTLQKKTYITYGLESSPVPDPIAANVTSPSPVTIRFNKKGTVKSITGVTAATNEVFQIRCGSVRNGKEMDAYLVTSTGRHYVE